MLDLFITFLTQILSYQLQTLNSKSMQPERCIEQASETFATSPFSP